MCCKRACFDLCKEALQSKAGFTFVTLNKLNTEFVRKSTQITVRPLKKIMPALCEHDILLR